MRFWKSLSFQINYLMFTCEFYRVLQRIAYAQSSYATVSDSAINAKHLCARFCTINYGHSMASNLDYNERSSNKLITPIYCLIHI